MGFFILMKCGADPFYSRIFSIAVAFLVTWIPSRLFIFLKLRRKSFLETVRYGVMYFMLSILNYAFYVKLLLTFQGLQPLLATVLSAVSSMLFVFLLYIRFMTRRVYFIKK